MTAAVSLGTIVLLAVGLGLYSMVAGQFMLALVALFIWVGAGEEIRRVTGGAPTPFGGGWTEPEVEVVVAAPWQAAHGYYRAPAGTGLDPRGPSARASRAVWPARRPGLERVIRRGGSFFGGRRFFRAR